MDIRTHSFQMVELSRYSNGRSVTTLWSVAAGSVPRDDLTVELHVSG